MVIMILRNISSALLLCVFLTLPLGMDLVRYSMGYWGISVLFMYLIILLTVLFSKTKVSLWAEFGFLKKPFDIRFILMAFWLLHLLSKLWANDLSLANSNLETKLSFLIMPIFFTLTYIDKDWRKAMFLAFVVGNVLACFYCLYDAYGMFQENGKVSEFIMKQFSELLHPSYFGMYLILSMMLAGNFILQKEFASKLVNALLGLSFLLFTVCVLLLQSKNAIVALFFIPLMLVVWYVVKKGKWEKGLAALIGILLIVGTAFYVTPNLQKRFANVYNSFTQKTIKADSKESTDARLIAWSAATTLIEKRLALGYGAGQEKDNLVRIYKENGNTEAEKIRLDAHSQYLQTGIALGLLGMVPLLFMFIRLIYQGYEKRNGLIILFSFLVFFSCLTESMFERQAGVLFFVFFALLLSGMPQNGTKEPA